MDFVKAASIKEIAPGSMKTVRVGGKPIALANVDGQFFAVSDTCTHEQCSLGTEGFLDGSIITCGCHGSQFEVTTGKVLSLPAPTNVASHEVKVEGDDVLVKI
ncbi:non-heme iron oxygenase ferredoxin subunit [Candidatus Gottesmanbacteria bacterium]|nr:non-heme iron oxygenase ferredoxin subunit [Candidatus Gottesmanbacteria bacterium]